MTMMWMMMMMIIIIIITIIIIHLDSLVHNYHRIFLRENTKGKTRKRDIYRLFFVLIYFI